MQTSPSMFITKFKFGVTMLGDGGFDTSWSERLDCVIGAAITSKIVSKDLQEKLFDNRKKVIYRPILTGLGGTKVEPGIPKQDKVIAQMDDLITKGFPVNHVVPQITPLLPLAWHETLNRALEIDYLANLRKLLSDFKKLGIKRVFHGFMMTDPVSASALKKIESTLVLPPGFFFNRYKEIALDVIDPDFVYETADPFYPYAKMNYAINEEDLRVLKLDGKYRLARSFDALTSLVQLINPKDKNCKGMCILCPFGNMKKFDIFNEH